MRSFRQVIHDAQNPRVLNLCIVTMVSFAIAQPLYDLLARHPFFFIARQSDPYEVLLLVIALSLIIPAILVGTGFTLRKLNNPLGLIYSALLMLGLFSLFLAPIVKRFAEGSFVVVAVTGSVALLLLLVYFVSSSFRSFLSILAISLLVFPLLFLGNGQIQKIVFAEKDPGNLEVPGMAIKSSPPIIMLVLDELPYISLLDANGKADRHRFPNIAALANDAHWFTNVSAVSDVTVFAVPALLSGLYPSQMKVPSSTDYPDNIFTWLGGQGYQVNAIESATRLCPDRFCTRTYTGGHRDRLMLMFRDVAYIYLHTVLPESIAARLPDISQGWGGFEFAASGARMDAFNNIDEWNAAVGASFSIDRMELFNQFMHGISKTEKPTFNFLHILFPHVPYEFFPDGKKYVPNNLPMIKKEKWLEDDWAPIQGYQRFMLQLGYLDTRIGELINHLKENGLYDEALIVITSDHGVSFHPGEGRRPISARTTADILPVPLIIKAPGQKQGTTSGANVETIDVLPSMMDILGVVPPAYLDGQSVFDPERKKQASKRYYSFKAEMFVTVPEQIPGITQALERKMGLFGEGSDRHGLYRLGRYGVIVGQDITQLNIGPTSQYVAAFDQSLMFNSMSIENAYVPARLTGVLSSDSEVEAAVDMAVSINGRIAATFTSYSSEPDRFSVMIPTEMLIDGFNQIEFYSVTQDGSGIELRPTRQLKQGLRTSWQLAPLLIKEFESGIETVFKMNATNLGEFSMVNDLTSEMIGDELLLTADGIDPYLHLPQFPLQPGYWHIVRLKIESPDYTQLQIYYLKGQGAKYNGEDTLIANLAPGENVVYLKIWDTKTTGSLRLDPGIVSGIYRLKELEIKAMRAPMKRQATRVTWETYPRLQKEFERGETLFEMTPDTLPEFIVLNELELTSSNDVLRLVSSGNDPYFQSPEFAWVKNREHLIKLVITSPLATQLQIYYKLKQQDIHYQDENSIITNLKEGKNELYLTLGEGDLKGRLRIDPGMAEGEYIIHAMEVRARKSGPEK